MAGQNSTEVVHVWFDQDWDFTLAAGQEAVWGFAVTVGGLWQLFANDHWVWFDATPINWPASVRIVTQWTERPDERLFVWRWVHFRNDGQTPVVVQPRALVAPNI